MAYFLRYTATPQADLERGTSLHLCDNAQEDAIFVEGIGWGVELNGLCAHSVEGDDLEDAIEDATATVAWARKHSGASGNYPEGDGYAAYLYEGKETGDCEDGVLFQPKRIVCNISELI